jgi:hypothetical protein
VRGGKARTLPATGVGNGVPGSPLKKGSDPLATDKGSDLFFNALLSRADLPPFSIPGVMRVSG